jgi:dTDP-4-dehydrorhamnose 3,5-epimerase
VAFAMQIQSTDIPDVLFIEPKVRGDARGFFMETFREDLLSKAGIKDRFVQDNHSGSSKGILRGLHYQIRHPQGKLVRAVVGEIFDAVVDLRRNSATFGEWMGTRLSAENRRMLWIPPGFAHGFYVLSDWAEVVYKATDYYDYESERVLLWDDSTIGIEWPLPDGASPILSEKDSRGVRFLEAEVFGE